MTNPGLSGGGTVSGGPAPAAGLAWEVVAPAAELGERPVWEASTGCVIWVDIDAGQLHRYSPADGDAVITTVGASLGAAAPRAGGGYVLATKAGFLLTNAAGEITGSPLRPGGMPDNVQFNDGAVDPAGRFWAGTQSPRGTHGTASLYRLDADFTATEVLGGVTESNGLAWSPDGATFYYTDSGEQPSRVRAFDFDLASGTLSRERDLITFQAEEGLADGIVTDAAGCLWIAMWNGGCVRQYSPRGELLALYPVPVSEVTCAGFGGPELTDVYLTSAWQDLDEANRAAEPLAGCLFRARLGGGVRGLPVACYAG
jgi:sugar lactone lactonase YvrE